MPFDALTKQQQKFLAKYLMPRGILKRPSADQQTRDAVSDDYQSWLTKRAEITAEVDALPQGADLAGVRSALGRADAAMKGDGKTLDTAAGKALLETDVKPAIADAQAGFCRQMKTDATAIVADMDAMHGVALLVPEWRAKLADFDPFITATPADCDAARALKNDFATAKVALKAKHDAFKTAYAESKKRIDKVASAVSKKLTDPVVATETAEINRVLAEARQKLEDGSDWLAYRMADQCEVEMQYCLRLIAKRKDYKPIKEKAKARIAEVKAARNAAIEEDVTDIESEDTKADRFEAERDFVSAKQIMEPIPDRVKALLATAALFADYEAAKQEAERTIKLLETSNLEPYTLAEGFEMTEIFDRAEVRATDGRLPRAIELMNEIPKRFKETVKAHKGDEAFIELGTKVESGDFKKALTEALKLLNQIKSNPHAAQVKGDLDAAESAITEARALAKEDENDARGVLARAPEPLASARQALAVIDRLTAHGSELQKRIDALRSKHAQAAYVDTQLTACTMLVTDGNAIAATASIGAMFKFDEAETKLADAKLLADAEVAYRTHRAQTQKAINKLAALDADSFPNQTAKMLELNTCLTTADAHSGAFDHTAAEDELRKADAVAAASQIAAKAKDGKAPSEKEIDALVASTSGEKELDAMIKDLSGEVQRQIMVKVMEARFDMDVEIMKTVNDKERKVKKREMKEPATSLVAMYEALGEVPSTHTRLNPSLARFDNLHDNDGSWYEDGCGRVAMCIRNMNDYNHAWNPMGDATQLPVVDVGCEARTDTPNPTYGKWTTMHEIGHAVDDRYGYMRSKGSNNDYGNWTEHGSNVGPIAIAVQGAFGYDLTYIETKLSGGSPGPVDLPDSELANHGGNVAAAQAAWDNKKTAVDQWYSAVKVNSEIWENGTESSNRAIGGRVYHEAYPGTWVSYALSARRKGVTGYQFRAPGEWFSELYAAFYTQKLKDTHPAYAWLETL